MSKVRHPVFARIYARISDAAEAKGAAEHRDEMLAGLEGRVVEVGATADSLPLEDGSCDAAVCSLVLCSVADQSQALAEVRRVLRPGGELRFYEHVLDDSPRFARFQRRVDIVHPYISGGCHVTRDTESAINDAGFEIMRIRRFRFAPDWLSRQAAPKILGSARLPSAEP